MRTLRYRIEDIIYDLIPLWILLLLVGCVWLVIVGNQWEVDAFNRVTGSGITYWDGFCLDLKIEGSK